MEARVFIRWSTYTALALAVCGGGAGCQHGRGFLGVDRGANIEPGAIPQPAGTYSCEWQQAQAIRAEQDDFVINSNEWHDGGRELGPDGRRHLAAIARRLPTTPFPVVVVADEDPVLNEMRKQIIIASLTEQGVQDAAGRTIVGESQAEGLYGTEAARYGHMRMMGVGGMGGGGGLGGGMGSGMGGGMGGIGGGMGGGMGMGMF